MECVSLVTVIGFVGIIVLVMFFIGMITRSLSLWFQAFISGTPISLLRIICMGLRKIPQKTIVNAFINAHKAGLKTISSEELETHYLAGGKVLDVVAALIAAQKADIPLDWRRATAIDLAGRDILDAVRTSVNPKVIDCPDRERRDFVTGVAKDGVQLQCHARVTVRTNIAQLVGGATEETIVARVGEGIISAIGAAETHLLVLENPQLISRRVLEKGLDDQTAFEILSIDIADVIVGENIGAKLRADKAESDKRIAQAKAEERRAMAVAMEQENIALVKEKEAELLEAQASVPRALAQSLLNGTIGSLDYFRLENIQADTRMRNSLHE